MSLVFPESISSLLLHPTRAGMPKGIATTRVTVQDLEASSRLRERTHVSFHPALKCRSEVRMVATLVPALFAAWCPHLLRDTSQIQ